MADAHFTGKILDEVIDEISRFARQNLTNTLPLLSFRIGPTDRRQLPRQMYLHYRILSLTRSGEECKVGSLSLIPLSQTPNPNLERTKNDRNTGSPSKRWS